MKKDFLATMVTNQNEIETSIYKAKKKFSDYQDHYKNGLHGDDSDNEDGFKLERQKSSENNSPSRKTVKYRQSNMVSAVIHQDDDKKKKVQSKTYIRPATANQSSRQKRLMSAVSNE